VVRGITDTARRMPIELNGRKREGVERGWRKSR
jgi:hypothetical protein